MMWKTLKALMICLALFLCSGVVFADEQQPTGGSSDGLTVLTGEAQKDVPVESSYQLEIPDGTIEEMISLAPSIQKAVDNGVCERPADLKEASFCLLRIAEDDGAFSFQQILLLRNVIEGNYLDTRLFVQMNPELFENYASQEERALFSNLGAIDYDSITSFNERYAFELHNRLWSSLSEKGGSEFDEQLDNAIAEDFVSNDNAFKYALANHDADALAYVAMNDYNTFTSCASAEEIETVKTVLASPSPLPSYNSISEKYFDILQEIQNGKTEEPYSESELERLGRYVHQKTGIPFSDFAQVGLLGAIPISIVGLGIALSESSRMTLGKQKEIPLSAGAATALTAISVFSSTGSVMENKKEGYEVNPDKYATHESNQILGELDKDIENQKVIE